MTVILVCYLRSFDLPIFISEPISRSTSIAQDRVVILLISPLFENISHTQHWDNVQRLLTFVYVQAAKALQEQDSILLQIDVLLKQVGEDVPSELSDAHTLFLLDGIHISTMLLFLVLIHV